MIRQFSLCSLLGCTIAKGKPCCTKVNKQWYLPFSVWESHTEYCGHNNHAELSGPIVVLYICIIIRNIFQRTKISYMDFFFFFPFFQLDR